MLSVRKTGSTFGDVYVYDRGCFSKVLVRLLMFNSLLPAQCKHSQGNDSLLGRFNTFIFRFIFLHDFNCVSCFNTSCRQVSSSLNVKCLKYIYHCHLDE